MSEERFIRPDPIHINCPYCWTEFQNFEQIGARIRFREKTYDHFEVLPIMENEPRAFRNYLKGFCNNFTRVKLQCSGCKRYYFVELFPFDRVHDNGRKAYRKYNEEDETFVGDYTLLEQLGLLSEKDSVVSALFDHYRRLLPYYIIPFLIIFFGFLVNNEKIITFSPILIIIFLFMGFLLSLYKWQNSHFKLIKTFDRMPFVIHGNYKTSYSFSIFQNKIIDRLGVYNKPDRWIWFIVTLLMVIVTTFLIGGMWQEFTKLDNLLALLLLFVGLVIFLTGIYIYYLIFAVIGSSLIDIFYRTFFIFKNIPIKLDPWDKSYGIQKITVIWSSAIITYIIVSWIFPAVIMYKSTFEFLFQLITATDKWVLIRGLSSNYGFLILVISNLIVILIFLYSIYLLHRNIDGRKDELKMAIKEGIEKISNKVTVTNQELSQILFMKLEYEQVEKIPSIPIPYGIALTIIYAIINVIVVIYGLLF